MIERNPLGGAYRFEAPQFVLYNTGIVIYWQSYEPISNRKNEKGFHHYTTKLSDSEFIELKTLLFDTTAIYKLKNKYALVKLREPIITQEFAWFKDDNKIITRYLYGQIENGFNTKLNELAFLYQIAKKIKNFKPQTKRKWLPEKIEVLFGPYEDASDKSIIWPSKWPGLNDPSSIDRTIKPIFPPVKNASVRYLDFARGMESIDNCMPYSVFIPSKDYIELMEFLKTKKEHGAIIIDGKKMFAETYLPMPCEKMWKIVSIENPIDEYKNIIFDTPLISRDTIFDDVLPQYINE